MSHPRNKPQITVSEVADFFAKLLKRRKGILSNLATEESIHVIDPETKICVPLVKTETGLVATTVMRGEMRRGATDLITL